MGTGTEITVADGDGIGPEIMDATLRILEAAGAELAIEKIAIGESVYRQGHSAGIDPAAFKSLQRTGVLLKAPVTTPQGGGVKSLNVTIRKALGLYANVRPCPAYAPFITTRHPGMDVVIIRENEEDVYAGIEHRQSEDVYQCLKLITRPGCERIARYTFEYARTHGRSKVSVFTKDNIMKMTDGLFRQVATEVAADYPDIAFEHLIVDIGAARLADTPDTFDVVLLANLYGDILSDVAAQIAGSVGLGASANIGTTAAMFEAIHGSAPDLAGRDVANPSGLLLSAVQMLVHIGQGEVASRIHNAWLATIEAGVHTADMFTDGHSTTLVGTGAFADAVTARLGEVPHTLAAVAYGAAPRIEVGLKPRNRARKEQVGVDVFLDCPDTDPELLGASLQRFAGPEFVLEMMSNRGQKVFPDGVPGTLCVDAFRCRFIAAHGTVTSAQVVGLLGRLAEGGFGFVKSEGLFTFDGVAGFSKGQGQ